MLNSKQICKLIPHTGDMCLLDSVKSWDEINIICTATSHTNTNNPLRNNQGLVMLSLLEYGAQAMAVHGGLLAQSRGSIMAEGYLAALKEVKVAQGLLSDLDAELKISAKQIYADGGNMIYTMTAQINNKQLMSGRATVIARFIKPEIAQ